MLGLAANREEYRADVLLAVVHAPPCRITRAASRADLQEHASGRLIVLGLVMLGLVMLGGMTHMWRSALFGLGYSCLQYAANLHPALSPI